MFRIIYMKADYEPWWQFEGWQEHIVSNENFESKEAFEKALNNKLQLFRVKYPFEKVKDQKYYAFWSEEESKYCEACEDDMQTFHGIIIEKS